MFFDRMATPDEIYTMKIIKMYDSNFELSIDNEFDESKAITPFIRSN
jgi:hypothetical protein